MSSIESALAAVIARLTERDRYLCRLLAAHDVLTTHQVCQAAFSGERRTSQRLSQLAGMAGARGKDEDTLAVLTLLAKVKSLGSSNTATDSTAAPASIRRAVPDGWLGEGT